jgi:hypothetical protein
MLVCVCGGGQRWCGDRGWRARRAVVRCWRRCTAPGWRHPRARGRPRTTSRTRHGYADPRPRCGGCGDRASDHRACTAHVSNGTHALVRGPMDHALLPDLLTVVCVYVCEPQGLRLAWELATQRGDGAKHAGGVGAGRGGPEQDFCLRYFRRHTSALLCFGPHAHDERA